MFHTHRTNSGEREYASLRKAAEAQAQNNAYVTGIEPPVGQQVAGNPNLGKPDTFAQPDTAGNIAPKQLNSTGNAELGVSATTNPSESPQEFQSRKMMETMQKIANGENRNYNDLPSIYT